MSARSGCEHAGDNFRNSGFGDWIFGKKVFGGRGLMEWAGIYLLGLNPWISGPMPITQAFY